MIKPNRGKWDNYDPNMDRLLFFAQSSREMLFDYTLDSYKVPTLNTHYRCIESIYNAELIKTGIADKKSMRPIIDEFLFSFSNDPVINEIFGTKKELYLKEIEKRKKEETSEDLIKILNIIKNELDIKYPLEVKNQLVRSMELDEVGKREIYNLARSALVELMYSGYSRGFIFHKINDFFFIGSNQQITKPNQIKSFLDSFDLKEKEFDVIFRLNENLGKYISSDSIDPRTDDDKEISYIKNGDAEFPRLFKFKGIKTKDPESARNEAEERLKFITSIIKYYEHKLSTIWKDDVLIYDVDNNNPIILKPMVRPILKRPDRRSAEIEEKFLDLFLEDRIDERSKDLIGRALEHHYEAISAINREHQLLTLWSTIEGLLTFPEKSPRITYIIKSINPLLVIDYPKKLIFDLHRQFEKNSNSSDLREILDGIDYGRNSFEKCAAIISIEENNSYREEIKEILGNNHILKYKIDYLNQQLSSASSIETAIKEHSNRVAWNVQRIYRVRNEISHSMVRSPLHDIMINMLIENLHSYVDRILDMLIDNTMNNPGFSIDDIFLKISLELSEHMYILERNRKSGKCNSENYLLYLFRQ